MQHGIVLFLGMVRRGEFESLQKRDLPLGVLADTNNRHRLGDVSRFAVVERFDFSRPLAELVEAVRGIQRRTGLQCLYNVGEYYVAQAADVAAALGAGGLSPASARLCLDKSLMRQRFQERIGPAATARFHVVNSEADLTDCANRLGYPVVLQPSNLAASMWSTCNSHAEMLLLNYRAMQSEVPAYYEKLGKKDARLTVVAAEFLEGSNTSIDCLADAAGRVYTTPVVDVLTGRDVGIDDFHHFARVVPSQLAARQQEQLERLAVAGVQALEMTTSAAHVEFIGPRLGEIAARPGGNRPRILELAYGIDEIHACYQVLCGQSPDLRGDRQWAAAIVTPFAARNGTLCAIRHLDRLVQLPGYLCHEVRIQPGQAVGLAKSGYRAPLYVELQSAAADDVRRSVDQIASWPDLYEVE
ncbi:MAG: ATP-grasp domain-containing protein [Planctomycetota bacterium]|nr:ATP-grasp domain-containing protein [Planctomycetota bacterium]